MADKRVLIVEDDLGAQKVARVLLEHHAMKVDTATTADQALDLLSMHSYSALLVDLSLPGKSGWELLAEIQDSSLAELPCVATTAYHSPAVAQEALDAGFIAYFPKPIDVRTFAETFTDYLE